MGPSLGERTRTACVKVGKVEGCPRPERTPTAVASEGGLRHTEGVAVDRSRSDCHLYIFTHTSRVRSRSTFGLRTDYPAAGRGGRSTVGRRDGRRGVSEARVPPVVDSGRPSGPGDSSTFRRAGRAVSTGESGSDSFRRTLSCSVTCIASVRSDSRIGVRAGRSGDPAAGTSPATGATAGRQATSAASSSSSGCRMS
jgi:hypothetical protein